MRVYLLVCGIFCMLLALEGCYAQRNNTNGRRSVTRQTSTTTRPGNKKNYVLTFRSKQDKETGKKTAIPVCGTVQKDVRGTFNKKNGLGKWGNELVEKFDLTSFSRNQQKKSHLVTNDHARIDLQTMLTRYKKRWANLQIQENKQPGKPAPTQPTTFAHLFLEADQIFPIHVIRNAFKESMTRCAKVWLEVAPQAGVDQDPL